MDKEEKLRDIWKKVTSFEEVYKDSSIKKMLGDKYGSDYKTMVNYLTEIGKTDGYRREERELDEGILYQLINFTLGNRHFTKAIIKEVPKEKDKYEYIRKHPYLVPQQKERTIAILDEAEEYFGNISEDYRRLEGTVGYDLASISSILTPSYATAISEGSFQESVTYANRLYREDVESRDWLIKNIKALTHQGTPIEERLKLKNQIEDRLKEDLGKEAMDNYLKEKFRLQDLIERLI